MCILSTQMHLAMSYKTIQCRLVSGGSTRQELWQLTAERNTPLVNELLIRVSTEERFNEWKLKGKIPATLVTTFCQTLKNDPRFSGQPRRFYKSAIHVVEYIYKSWLALQGRLRSQLAWNIRWLSLLNSDASLVEVSGYSLAAIRARAADILAQIASQEEADSKGSLFNRLLAKHRSTQKLLERCAINHLLKNRCQVNLEEENAEKFAKRRRKTEIQIDRLQKRLETSRAPQGRDLTGEKWSETLEIATTTSPIDEHEASRWQSTLLKESSSVPFPIGFETNEDLRWFKNEKGRICVRFPGMAQCFVRFIRSGSDSRTGS